MYSLGVWAHALPKLFMDTYKTPFPENVLDNLSLLMDMWTVEYPIPHDKSKVMEYDGSVPVEDNLIITVKTQSQGPPSYLHVLNLFIHIMSCHFCIFLWSGHPV